MNNQTINIAKYNAKKTVTAALLIISSLLLSGRADAAELETTHSTVSYGELSQALNDQIRANITTKNAGSLTPDQTTDKATGKTRDEIQKLQQATADTSSLMQPMSRSYAPEFSIYNAFTTLYDDFDQDGFYQSFSVVFDADMYSYDGYDSSAVYALLYIRENGGPWIHYYTTDDFFIHSDSDQDEYEVITTFLEGYHPGHYDLLIDLYQVGYPYVVATYSSNDSEALYALPLESNDHDQVYVDTVYIHHGGSLSAWSLALLLLLLAARLSPALSQGVKRQLAPYSKLDK
ncbi:MAG TPA: choice-of-anchor H family protein [Psychromonas sp.]